MFCMKIKIMGVFYYDKLKLTRLQLEASQVQKLRSYFDKGELHVIDVQLMKSSSMLLQSNWEGPVIKVNKDYLDPLSDILSRT